jgi:very-short-patch-repair endonuclease
MDSHLRKLAARQADVVAAWQLRAAGWSAKRVSHHAAQGGWRAVHPGVYVLTQAPPTRRQLWFGATLTAPGSVLSHGSAGACYGFYRFERGYEVVTRSGQGGRRRHGGVLTFRSKTLDGEVTSHLGIPITTAARVLIDLSGGLDQKQLGRAFRESIRLKRTTAPRVLEALRRHRRRPGTGALGALASRYATLPYGRTRSDAEGRALEVLHDAGLPPPRVNTRVHGEEADLVWAERRLIVEVDGPQFHQFRDQDVRKERAWRAAGYDVRRVASGSVYDAPTELVALAARS